jgi:hypothetical protein
VHDQTVPLVRIFTAPLGFLLRLFECHVVLNDLLCLLCSPLLSGRKLGQIFCGRWQTRMQKPPRLMRRSCRLRSRRHMRSSASKRSWRARRRKRSLT